MTSMASLADRMRSKQQVGDHAGLQSELVDVSGLDLDQIEALPDSVLVSSLRRVFTENTQTPDQYAAFQSYL
jgi:FXSXX-COOH protein